MDDVVIRNIVPADNPALAVIIRSVLAEFGANHPGTVYYDGSTDHLSILFEQKGSAYYTALVNHEIVGGAGICHSAGLPENTCELVKMYLSKTARGIGLGKILIRQCIDFASEQGYHHIYLETMPELKKAMSIYEKFGFYYLKGPMGNTGHYGCEVWMLKDL
jgi:putative acetyltransferase